jgi:protein involved in polysaccharide export with SLBB domain
LLTVAGLSAGLAGCNNKFFDPSQIGRFRPTPAVNVILDSLGVAEESSPAWENAQEPRPSDIVAANKDYVLQPGDLVRISIFELLQEGSMLVNDYVVSETGKLSIPDVGVIQAAGLTETQLEQEIKHSLSPSILREPSVTVMLLDSQQRTYAILGNGVARPNRYLIPRYDFRLMDALSTAGAQMQFNVSYVYVSRKQGSAGGTGEAGLVRVSAPQGGTTGHVPELETIRPGSGPLPSGSVPPASGRLGNGKAGTPPGRPEIPEPAEPAEKFETEREMLDLIAPQAGGHWPPSGKIAGSATGGAQSNSRDDVVATVMSYGFRPLVPPMPPPPRQAASQRIVASPTEFGAGPPGADVQNPAPASADSTTKPRVEWVFDKSGKWVKVPVGEEPGREGSAGPSGPAGGFGWELREGRWVPVPKGEPLAPRPAARSETQAATPLPRANDANETPTTASALPLEMEWEQAIQTRLIRIPTDKLLAGDPRYNIVVKPGDTIHVPVDIIGEFAIMGNVNRSGFIELTGRPMTLKMAIAAAGGLGPLAYPKHVEVVRRIGTKKEEIVLVDLDKIAAGEQPDFFIKPNDLINVGTEATARWRAVLRNAFRAAYGFAFVYDRNFADIDYGTGFPWFTNF